MGIVNTIANDVTRENANMNADTPAGMMMKFASETSKPFVLDMLISDLSKDYVKSNYIHIHDADYYPTKSLTCIQHRWTEYCKTASEQVTAQADRQKN